MYNKFLVPKYVNHNDTVKYSKEEFTSGVKEYQFSNNSNIDDNGSSYFESSYRGREGSNFDSYLTNDVNFKLNNDYDSEYKYDNVTPNPK